MTAVLLVIFVVGLVGTVTGVGVVLDTKDRAQVGIEASAVTEQALGQMMLELGTTGGPLPAAKVLWFRAGSLPVSDPRRDFTVADWGWWRQWATTEAW